VPCSRGWAGGPRRQKADIPLHVLGAYRELLGRGLARNVVREHRAQDNARVLRRGGLIYAREAVGVPTFSGPPSLHASVRQRRSFAQQRVKTPSLATVQPWDRKIADLNIATVRSLDRLSAFALPRPSSMQVHQFWPANDSRDAICVRTTFHRFS
jgi:hypothetical protein